MHSYSVVLGACGELISCLTSGTAPAALQIPGNRLTPFSLHLNWPKGYIQAYSQLQLEMFCLQLSNHSEGLRGQGKG